jgi:hypothetical protein
MIKVFRILALGLVGSQLPVWLEKSIAKSCNTIIKGIHFRIQLLEFIYSYRAMMVNV